MTKLFDVDLEEVFGERAEGFSEDLRAALLDLWRRAFVRGMHEEELAAGHARNRADELAIQYVAKLGNQ